MIQQFRTQSGSEYMIVPFNETASTLLQRKGNEFESVGRIQPTNSVVKEGVPFVCTFSTDIDNGQRAGQTLRTSTVTYTKMVDNTKDATINTYPDIDESKVPSWVTDAEEVYTKNTKYLLAATDTPSKKLIFGGQFNGEEIEISGSVEVGKPLSMAMTDAPQNGHLKRQIFQTSNIQGVRSVVIGEQSNNVLAADGFKEAIDSLQNVKQSNLTM